MENELVDVQEQELTNISLLTNTSGLFSNYVFTPIYPLFKAFLVILTIPCGLVGLVGNAFILYFTFKARNARGSLFRRRSFNRSLLVTHFVRSLAVSDILGSIVITFMLCFEQVTATMINSPERSLWVCWLSRFPYYIFPFVTINNLLVISMERYFSVFRPFRVPTPKTVKRLVVGAWLLGIGVSLMVTVMAEQVRYDLHSNQYTITCKFTTNDVFWKKIVFACVAMLQYFIPNFLLIYISISITQFLHKRRSAIQVGRLRYSSQAWRFQGTRMFVRVFIAFALPCSLFFFYGIVNIFIKYKLSFKADYVVRCASAFSVLFNSAINPLIYCTSSVYFSEKLRKNLWCLCTCKKPNKISNQYRVSFKNIQLDKQQIEGIICLNYARQRSIDSLDRTMNRPRQRVGIMDHTIHRPRQQSMSTMDHTMNRPRQQSMNTMDHTMNRPRQQSI
jgi:hypothetical protein